MTRERFGIWASRIVLVSLVLLSFAVSSHAAAQDGSGKAVSSDYKRVEGKWQRPDGGYVLELKEVKKDGTIKAAYFNPRPINVAKAEFKRKDSMLTVFVELHDVNYPGSTYNLLYEPKSDRLVGTYFQAVQGLTYDIEFRRAK